ncbi:lipopolysaccharide heptosyltransferase II [Nevskia ramosa]|uniref:lipopolysaccharide heptosyltransferase II n=1 Tax=Nevskia ramosa TaxID=64002 RepID=UPI0003B74C65|nr:lipopolysaccharide heptosyltransferase II [Nevskia ramosa]
MTADLLIVGPAWVGDMVMAQSLFIRLHERYPDAAIDVLAPGWSLPIIGRMPEIRAGIELPFAHGEFNFGGRRRLGLSLRDRGYAQAIVLPNSWKSAVVPFFADIPRRSGYAREFRYGLLNDLRPLNKALLKTTPQRFVALADDGPARAAPAVPAPRFRADAERAAQLRADLALGDGPGVALMPGAEYGPAKQWPAAYYAQLAADLGRQGIRSWIIGSKKELLLGAEIVAASNGAAINLCGRTSLVDVIDLVSVARAVVCNDSGPMHIAAAAGAKVVAIYGSSTPDHTPPMTTHAAIHYRRLSCSPCFERNCPLKPPAEPMACLTGIHPDEVLSSLTRLADL